MTLYFYVLLIKLVILSVALPDFKYSNTNNNKIVIKPSGDSLMTDKIQRAIDDCESKGGGVVRFAKGEYYSGTILLKSNVTLHLHKKTTIKGSDHYSDYSNDAFFYGRDVNNVAITGKGTIDGVDCYNPKGEEGFRGPHCIRLINCTNISFKDITIINSANWAINCRYCSNGTVRNVRIRGGHDGLHTRFCEEFTVEGCDFRTGDDAFAGNDNRNFTITNCKINTSCNGFRMGCMNLRVEKCYLWGPGEYSHKIQNRNNMLSAFVHFSPKDQKPVLQSGNWVIKDITVNNVDVFFIYNFRDGLWQTGQPFTAGNFENVKASGILRAFYIYGDTGRLFKMNINNSQFSYRENSSENLDRFEGSALRSPEFFYAENFDSISLQEVTLTEHGKSVMASFVSGNNLTINRLYSSSPVNVKPYIFSQIDNINTLE
ncbi:MAG: glycosyl hydrolase family 28 protein [Bacteroidales bacterium]